MTARVTPGVSALDIQAQYAAAQEDLAAALAAAQVADLAAARQYRSAAPRTAERRDQLTATLAGLCGDDDVEQLRSRLAELRSLPAFSDDVDDRRSRRPRRTRRGRSGPRHRRAPTAKPTARVAALAMSKLTEISTQATRLQDKLVTQRAELDGGR